MIERMKELKPLVACFNGKGIYEIFSGVKKCEVGTQTEPLPGTDTVSYHHYFLFLSTFIEGCVCHALYFRKSSFTSSSS